MTLELHAESKGFLLVAAPAAIGGALWEGLGLPLGWLMGAAVVTGAFAMCDVISAVPKPLYSLSLAVLGANVGLEITPEVAMAMAGWAPVMVVAAAIGVSAAISAAPILARLGKMDLSTAFFALLPGGVIEMANVGGGYGADRTIVAALHAVRVGLVVGLLPLALYLFGLGEATDYTDAPVLEIPDLALTLGIGALGGWIGTKAGLPASWLLGALISVGSASSLGLLSGRVPDVFLAAVQVFVGISLGARFQRARLSQIPRALAVGLPVLLVIMSVMALAAALVGQLMPYSLATLILCFSIGGMAEMVLTSKALGQGVALVAAFQAVRGILVNASAGLVWRRYLQPRDCSNSSKD